MAQDPHDLRVRPGQECAEPQTRGEAFGGIADAVQALVDGLGELLHRVVDGRVEQFRLGAEVAAEGAEPHVRALCDGPDAGAGVAGLRQDLPRGADECLPGLGTTAIESIAGWN